MGAWASSFLCGILVAETASAAAPDVSSLPKESEDEMWISRHESSISSMESWVKGEKAAEGIAAGVALKVGAGEMGEMGEAAAETAAADVQESVSAFEGAAESSKKRTPESKDGLDASGGGGAAVGE